MHHSPNLARLLPSFGPRSANEGDEGEHRVGKIGKEGVLATVARDQAYRTVGDVIPVRCGKADVS